MSIIKQVRILVREGNEGIWRIVENLDYCQWVDLVDGNITATYTFYNDIATTAIDDATVNKPYDDVPLECGDGLVIKNRAVLSNVTKGYDTPDCLEVVVEQDFQDNPQQEGYTISGLVRIFSEYLEFTAPLNPAFTQTPFEIPSTYKLRGGIYHDTSRTNEDAGGNFPFFGGGGYGSGTSDFNIRAGMETDFDQRIPEGGFPVYLAGTDFLSISRQIDVGLVTDPIGALDTSQSSFKTSIGNYLQPSLNNDLFSGFEIRNVPAGKYVIRLASHWCSFGNKLDKGGAYDLLKGRGYQRTSTNVWAVNVYDESTGTYTWTNACEIEVEVTNSDVFIGEFIVRDLAPRWNVDLDPDGLTATYYNLSGYLFDDNGKVNLNDPLSRPISVEKTLVELTYSAEGEDVFGLPTVVYYGDIRTFTDHNGYFYIGMIPYWRDKGIYRWTETGTYTNIKFFQVNQNTSQLTLLNAPLSAIGLWFPDWNLYKTLNYTGTLQDLYSRTLVSQGGAQPAQTNFVVMPTNIAIGRTNCSTLIKGKVIDQNGDGVSNSSIVYTWGKTATTDNDGFFLIQCWGDALKYLLFYPTPPQSDNNRVADKLFVMSSPFCDITYITTIPILVDISEFGNNSSVQENTPPYSPTSIINIGDIVVQENYNLSIKARKRGGSYLLGGRFYDEHGRFCSVVQASEVYIPYITEDLNTYFPDKYTNPNTYKYGRPTITATITTPPPSWAKYFRFMWTKNLYQGKYLQWCANEVKYITSYDNDLDTFIETTYQNGDATMIMINISNIATYARQNNNSQVGYSYEDGDRLRLIADRDINYFNGLFDTEVFGYKTGGWLLIQNRVSLSEIKSGTFFEVYNNRPVTEDKLFFECGQTIKITNGAYENDTVVFDSGDTYWRGRSIPVLDDSTNFSAIYPLVVEDRSISDFFASEDEDIGRVGVIDETFKQIHYPTMMQHSNVFIEGSAVNGLSSFETSNFKILNVNFGAITRLVYVGNTLISVHTNKVVANYIELRSLSDANQTDGLLAISDAYFGNDRPMQSEYGSDKYNSIASYQGFVYGLDTAKGVVWRYDNNGIDAISDKLVRSYIRQLCADGVERAVGVFDPYFRMYFLTTTNSDGEKSTIGWDEDKNRWSSFYSFTPEMYSYIQRDLVSFKDGQLWLHNTNTLYNNFYGVQYRSEITPIVCKIGDKQTFHAISFYGIQGDPLNSEWEIEQITNRYGQQSRLKKAHFRLKENLWAASFLRDTTDTTVTNPIVNGRNLRGEELVLKFVNSSPLFASIQTIFTTIVKSFR
jgi:hypothetical protein